MRKILTIVLVLVLVGIAYWAYSAAADPERAMNTCENPIKWSKAEGEYDVHAVLGNIFGSFSRIDVSVKDTRYSSEWSLFDDLSSNSIWGKKGNAWVTSYATLSNGDITNERNSEKVAYDFPLLTADSGSIHGSFRTGEVCADDPGSLIWHFTLKAQDDGDSKIFTVATAQREVQV